MPIERWAKASDCGPEDPVVLTVEGTHGPIVHAVTRAAAERGAKAGARLTDARALDPSLVAVAADPDGDRALLQRLAKWAQRCVASLLHCTEVWAGPSFFTLTATWQNRQSTEASPELR